MEDILSWIKTVITVLTLSVTTAYGAYVTRKTGKGRVICNVMLIEAYALFNIRSVSGLIYTAIIVIFLLVLMFSMLRNKYEQEPDESGKEEEPWAES